MEILNSIETDGFSLTKTLETDYLKNNGITFTPIKTIEYMYKIIFDKYSEFDILNIKIIENNPCKVKFYNRKNFQINSNLLILNSVKLSDII